MSTNACAAAVARGAAHRPSLPETLKAALMFVGVALIAIGALTCSSTCPASSAKT